MTVCLAPFQIVDGNAKTDVSNRREPGMFCGESEQPQTFISETSYVKVVFHTDNFTDQVTVHCTAQRNCSGDHQSVDRRTEVAVQHLGLANGN